jgi:molybdate transport system substrate-binding protein
MCVAHPIFHHVGGSLLRLMMRNLLRHLLLLSIFPLSAQAEKPLRIAVSSNFSPILKQLLPEFKQQIGINTQIISGVTGGLYQQIKHGAPYDVFLSADSLRPQKLAQDKLIVVGSRKTYAFGQLALYSAQKSHLNWQDVTDITHDNSKRLAIANPKTAPYGKAAQQCLQKQELWQAINRKLVIGNNIGQTFQQVRSQAVFIGIVAFSQLKLNKLSGELLPQSCYSPIKQQLVILKNSAQIKAAQQLSDFLLSAKSQQKIAQWGYSTEINADD